MPTKRAPAEARPNRGGPPGTNLRNFRADDSLWEAAKATAKRRAENLSDHVLRPALEDYVKLHAED